MELCRKNLCLAYDREVNQIWTADKNNVGGSFIDLGIQKKETKAILLDSNQQFMAFQVNGDVYVMDLNERKIKQVYNLNAKNAEQLNNTKARSNCKKWMTRAMLTI